MFDVCSRNLPVEPHDHVLQWLERRPGFDGRGKKLRSGRSGGWNPNDMQGTESPLEV